MARFFMVFALHKTNSFVEKHEKLSRIHLYEVFRLVFLHNWSNSKSKVKLSSYRPEQVHGDPVG
jgi:hypothetical protein